MDALARLAGGLVLVTTLVACKDSGRPPEGATATALPAPGGPPAVGAHALAFQRFRAVRGLSAISTPALATAGGGHSTLVVSVGRGAFSASAPPTDNKNAGPFPQLGAAHTYTQWPTSGTALYARTGALGGSGHIVTASTPTDDEVTFSVVEVVNGTRVEDFQWNEVAAGDSLTSVAVTTTGPAVLVAYWWGDAGVGGEMTTVPNNGFSVVDSVLQAGALVQCAVATRTVSAAGTYDVTWESTPVQGAQLWLAAVQ